MSVSDQPAPFFDSFPIDGPWTSLGLSRWQFLGTLALSIALFVAIDGPLWRHLHEQHFLRLTLSYAAIPFLVTASLWANKRLNLTRVLVATAVISLVKLVATALLLVLFTLAG